jgi:hypothetical protein
MAEIAKIEKFTTGELAELRKECMKTKIDSWQAAELISSFLAGRGYGVNANAMRRALPHMASTEAMQEVLERVAYVM